MQLIDTHTHLFAEEFDEDRDAVVQEALAAGVVAMLLPNIDIPSIAPLWALHEKYPRHCLPMAGLHPTSVDGDYTQALSRVKTELETHKYYGVGEIGIDLYWDTTYAAQQKEAFATQIEWARSYNLPFVIHARESYPEIFDVLEELNHPLYKGIFHSFTGDYKLAMRAIEMGFMIGMGGIATFKNAGVGEVLAQLPLARLVLETDSPYLAPVPKRGKRNKSAYLVHINKKLAQLKGLSPEKTAAETTKNAVQLFALDDILTPLQRADESSNYGIK